MATVENRLAEMGLSIPPALRVPSGMAIPFAWARAHGDRLLVSGHGAQNAEGSPAGPFGKVPSEVSLERAQDAAAKTVLAMLGSIKREIGDLGRIRAWLIVNAMVNADPGFEQTTSAVKPFSGLLVKVFGEDIGRHARTAIGMAALPLNLSVVISAELAISME